MWCAHRLQLAVTYLENVMCPLTAACCNMLRKNRCLLGNNMSAVWLNEVRNYARDTLDYKTAMSIIIFQDRDINLDSRSDDILLKFDGSLLTGWRQKYSGSSNLQLLKCLQNTLEWFQYLISAYNYINLQMVAYITNFIIRVLYTYILKTYDNLVVLVTYFIQVHWIGHFRRPAKLTHSSVFTIHQDI
jgi:hypothetical protein